MNNYPDITKSSETKNKLSIFCEDIFCGLTATAKYLDSKYFYDVAGDKLFQQIMHSPEYYPTNCELEILSQQTDQIVAEIQGHFNSFDLIELGAGDALKSSHLLHNLLQKNNPFTYFPIDISKNVITTLSNQLPDRLPGLNIQGLNGEYFEMLTRANSISNKNKVVLFLGSNIGNMFPADAERFCLKLKEHLLPGDLLFIGFDLKKNPKVILDAYNDKQGFTRDFNLNLLNRINTELDADFNLANFQHYPTYDPQTGACKSYLVSTEDQQVYIAQADKYINFAENECIYMEISQKYTLQQTLELAQKIGFTPITHFFDSKKWFVDSIWKC